jgi:hypothetical protein
MIGFCISPEGVDGFMLDENEAVRGSGLSSLNTFFLQGHRGLVVAPA